MSSANGNGATKRGRPTKATNERMDRILKSLRAGNYLETAARCAGIHPDTLNEWRKHFPAFSEEVEKARAEAEESALDTILVASHDNWQAAGWYLERCHPDRYARRQRIEHTTPEGGDLARTDFRKLTDTQLSEIHAKLAEVFADRIAQEHLVPGGQ